MSVQRFANENQASLNLLANRIIHLKNWLAILRFLQRFLVVFGPVGIAIGLLDQQRAGRSLGACRRTKLLSSLYKHIGHILLFAQQRQMRDHVDWRNIASYNTDSTSRYSENQANRTEIPNKSNVEAVKQHHGRLRHAWN